MNYWGRQDRHLLSLPCSVRSFKAAAPVLSIVLKVRVIPHPTPPFWLFPLQQTLKLFLLGLTFCLWFWGMHVFLEPLRTLACQENIPEQMLLHRNFRPGFCFNFQLEYWNMQPCSANPVPAIFSASSAGCTKLALLALALLLQYCKVPFQITLSSTEMPLWTSPCKLQFSLPPFCSSLS